MNVIALFLFLSSTLYADTAFLLVQCTKPWDWTLSVKAIHISDTGAITVSDWKQVQTFSTKEECEAMKRTLEK